MIVSEQPRIGTSSAAFFIGLFCVFLFIISKKIKCSKIGR